MDFAPAQLRPQFESICTDCLMVESVAMHLELGFPVATAASWGT